MQACNSLKMAVTSCVLWPGHRTANQLNGNTVHFPPLTRALLQEKLSISGNLKTEELLVAVG